VVINDLFVFLWFFVGLLCRKSSFDSITACGKYPPIYLKQMLWEARPYCIAGQVFLGFASCAMTNIIAR